MLTRSVLLGLIVLASAAHAQMYRWVDKDGNVNYSDQPPPPDARDVEERRGAGKPADQPLPYALDRAVRNFPVALYTSSCGEGCARASELLARRGIPHTVYDATQPAFQDRLKELAGGQLVVPVLQVGQSVLRGFEAGQWNTALDAAGYPATALVKVTPEQATPPAPPAPPEAQAGAEQPPAETGEPAEEN